MLCPRYRPKLPLGNGGSLAGADAPAGQSPSKVPRGLSTIVSRHTSGQEIRVWVGGNDLQQTGPLDIRWTSAGHPLWTRLPTRESARTAGALNATRAGCYPAKRQLGDVTVVTSGISGISMQLTRRFLPLGCPRMRQETSFRTLERRRDIVPSPMANKMHDYSYADARTPNDHQGSKKLANAAGLRQ
ncbi:hypothetical protein I7I51_02323 [Histoplasma capsulatum]|uniref:Uncharacterized protein n=1 Tax=Ajellomyces capsulatus TaxID=5037 RepID=A0A8A1M9Z0_AJECA|nr:predicted protein [Histoplasma mississippiense (nom. inval.)]EDN04596.1 predicted protein [Histoplasma mississippiense (nom. inval.)]QSS62585.1 hypothetical protein I7I51_02323 [Histoplasma capsulatum]